MTPNYFKNNQSSQNRLVPSYPQKQSQAPYKRYASAPARQMNGMANENMWQASTPPSPNTPNAYSPYNGNASTAQQPMPVYSTPSYSQPSASMTEYCMPLAMAWFEDQKYGSTYEPENAMERGTLFPELDKPWLAPKRRP